MRRSWSSRVAACVGVGLLLLPTTGRAQDADDEDLIRQGLELRRLHRNVEALPLFQHAFAIRPTARARAQIGLAEQSLGQWVAAESDLTLALRADDPWIGRNRQALEEALGFVSTHLGWLLVSCNVQGARVSVNGTSIGTVPMANPARVAAGTALVRLEADGYVPVERTVNVAANEHLHEFEVLGAVAPAGARADAVPAPTQAKPVTATGPVLLPPPRRSPPLAAWGLAALGGAGVVVGGIFGVEALTDKSARDQHCAAGRCDSIGLGYDSQGRDAATVSTIAFGVGAAALLGSGWLFWRASRDSVHVAPVATAGGAGLGACGVW